MSESKMPSASRKLLGRADLPDCPGYEMVLYLMSADPGFEAPPHTHTGPGLGFVVQGQYESHYQGEDSRVFHAGEGIYDLVETPHLVARNPSPAEPLQFVMAFVVKKGQPDVQPLEP